jgi:hypothetical protein
MKKCVQCGSEFPDDYLFCLKDGADLVGLDVDTVATEPVDPDGDETPTIAASAEHVPLPETVSFSVSTPVATGTSSIVDLPADPPQIDSPAESFDLKNVWNNPQIIVPVGALLIVVIVVIAVAMSGSGGGSSSVLTTQTPEANKARSVTYATSTPASTPMANTAESSDSDYRIGKYATLDTNLRLRSASNKFASIVGVHYKGARIRVLETDEYDTPEGYSTWFRVEVVEDGCDAEGNLGCGHEGDTSGWMNAKYVTME